jgi:two-component system sensor histidine kinase MprB
MSFRKRLTLATAGAVAVAVALASGVVWLGARGQLRGEVDASLRSRVKVLQDERLIVGGVVVTIPLPKTPGAPGGYVQLVRADGAVLRPSDEPGPLLPATGDVRRVAAGTRRAFLADIHVSGLHYRVITASFAPGIALQVARPLNEVDAALHRLALVLILVTLAGVGLAVGLGLLVTRAAVTPVAKLTEATEHVTATGDLSGRIDATGDDEISRLAASFNRMLEALEGSQRAQRQLVADASHELRTPLTSLRTNIEVLGRAEDLSPEDRTRLVEDVVAQMEEMTALVADLVDLAREAVPQAARAQEVRLDLVTEHVVERWRKRAPDIRFVPDVEPCLVSGVPERLERAIGNLIDNAVKWSPPGGEVEVRVQDGEVVVRDQGPGIDPKDQPFVFDRFYRAPGARGMPGSGLGLAIVKQVADTFGGTATAEAAQEGGALFRLRFPPALPPIPPAPHTARSGLG